MGDESSANVFLISSIVFAIMTFLLILFIFLLLFAGIRLIQGRGKIYTAVVVFLNLSFAFWLFVFYLYNVITGSIGFDFGSTTVLLTPVLILSFGLFGVIFSWNTFVSENEWKEIKKEKKRIREEARERARKKREEERTKKHYYEDHWSQPDINIEDQYDPPKNDQDTDSYYLEKWGRSYYEHE